VSVGENEQFGSLINTAIKTNRVCYYCIIHPLSWSGAEERIREVAFATIK
jgi:hypothetical protein